MKSKVFFSDMRANPQQNLFKKIKNLLKKIDLKGVVEQKDLVALKIHFGERGNTAHVKPAFVRVIVDFIKNKGGRPFLTDTNTLYTGSRKESVSHLETAIANGFGYSVVDAPLLIADGLRGTSFQAVPVGLKWYREVEIGADIVNADALVAITHFKCHELTGFGGVIKNIGMGCASLKGKLSQHSDVSPYVEEEICTGCKNCLSWCPADGAIKQLAGGKVAIDPEKCIGCGECILPCRPRAVRVRWNANTGSMQEKMVEHVYGTLKGKKSKFAFITFLTDISPSCDCYPSNDIPVVEDIGFLVSRDPVAIDQAAADLVNQKTGNRSSRLKGGFQAGEDKFRGVYPEVDWSVQLSYARKIGLGNRDYELIKV